MGDKSFSFVVPKGAKAGDEMQIQTPGGERLILVLPADVKPGQKLMFPGGGDDGKKAAPSRDLGNRKSISPSPTKPAAPTPPKLAQQRTPSASTMNTRQAPASSKPIAPPAAQAPRPHPIHETHPDALNKAIVLVVEAMSMQRSLLLAFSVWRNACAVARLREQIQSTAAKLQREKKSNHKGAARIVANVREKQLFNSVRDCFNFWRHGVNVMKSSDRAVAVVYRWRMRDPLMYAFHKWRVHSIHGLSREWEHVAQIATVTAESLAQENMRSVTAYDATFKTLGETVKNAEFRALKAEQEAFEAKQGYQELLATVETMPLVPTIPKAKPPQPPAKTVAATTTSTTTTGRATPTVDVVSKVDTQSRIEKPKVTRVSRGSYQM